MPRISDLLRLLVISFTLVRHGMDDLLLASHLFRPLRFLRPLMPWTWWVRQENRGARIRRVLESLGPIFIKFGQILSTRRDLLPDDIAIELAKLQDQVPPFPAKQARAIIEKAYGQSLSTVFAEFEPEAFASASIAQVHGAVLHSGEQVVVKVLRPDILPVIQRDIRLLYILADKLSRYWPLAKQLRPREVVAEFEKTLLDELDLMREAANAAQLRRNFLSSSLLYVPEVHWSLCRRNVMVLERIHGIPIGQIKELQQAGVDLKVLSEKGVEIFFTQVFRHSFFHADMHPGNIFVDPSNGRYIAVDFGIMGSLNPSDQRYLAENFLAFFNRDYRRVAQLHVDSGWVAKDTRLDEFEAAIRTVCEPIFDKPLKEISFGHLLLRLFQTARRFNMEVQPQLVLLQKTLLNIEGLGRQLYPELDLWKTAKPFLERWMAEQIGPRALWRHLRENIPLWAERLPQIPNMLFDVLSQAKEGRLKYELKSEQLEALRQTIHQANRRTVAAIVGSSFVLAASVLLTFGDQVIDAPPWLAWAMGGAGLLTILLAWPRKPK